MFTSLYSYLHDYVLKQKGVQYCKLKATESLGREY